MNGTTACHHCQGLVAGKANQCHHCKRWLRRESYHRSGLARR
jgi:RNA polymerase subunit RPABC4/transcription elongation factor Spt4